MSREFWILKAAAEYEGLKHKPEYDEHLFYHVREVHPDSDIEAGLMEKAAYKFATETNVRAPADPKNGDLMTSALGCGFISGARWMAERKDGEINRMKSEAMEGNGYIEWQDKKIVVIEAKIRELQSKLDAIKSTSGKLVDTLETIQDREDAEPWQSAMDALIEYRATIKDLE